MEIENTNNSQFYKYSESGIKKRNLKLWEDINSTQLNIPFKEKFYLLENKLEYPPKCYCGNSVKFLDMYKGYRLFCSKRCMFNNLEIKEKRKNTCISKWGVDNPSKSNEIKNRVKETNNIKFGTDYPLQSKDIRDKLKEKFIEKWGVDNPSKVPEIRQRANETIKDKWGVDHIMFNEEIKKRIKERFLNNWGVDNPSKVKEIRNKAKKTNLERWGFESALQNSFFVEKMKKTNQLKWGSEFYTQTEDYRKRMNDIIFQKNSGIVNSDNLKLIESETDQFTIFCKICEKEFVIQRQLYRNRFKSGECICLNCNPINNGISNGEKLLVKFIREIYKGTIIENYRNNGKELDVYLPQLNLGFEYNGLYWHSELNKPKMYHYEKYKFFEQREIEVFTIWEDDWKYRNEVVKSMIGNKIGLSKRIYARNCHLIEVTDNKLCREFLDSNHIQGFVGARTKLGLFSNGELVSLMTFGSLRKSLGSGNKKGQFELIRFCNKLDTSVIGAASKLLKYFIETHKPTEIISYSLNSHSKGDLYQKLGFAYVSETKYNYFWSKNNIRYHRFNFRKDKLIKQGESEQKSEKEIMYDRGYFRVFDSGSKKWRLIC